MNTRFAVNKDGENGLLYALKHGKEDLFQSYRRADINPFIPSRYAQCAAGLLVTGFGNYHPYTVEDWRYENTVEAAGTHGITYSPSDLSAYTLPLLSGPHLAVAVDNMNKLFDYKNGLLARDAWGYTPLMYAIGCCHRNFNAMITLNPNKVFTNQGSGDCDPVALLLQGYSVLPPALTNQKYFLARANLQPCDFSDSMTIHEAAARGLSKPLRRLLKLGVDIDCRSFNGSTPLMCAALYGQNEICAYLLDHGASTSLRNHLGQAYEDLYKASYHIFPSFPAPIKFSENILWTKPNINAETYKATSKSENVFHESVNMEPDATVSKEKVSVSDPFLDAFITTACNGQFQPMVAFFYKIKDYSSIPFDIINRIIKKRCKNQDLIIDWIYYQCNKREIKIADSYVTSKESINKFQISHSINFDLDEFSTLYVAARDNQYPLYQWLLRHCALISLSPVKRTVLVSSLDPKFKRAWEKQQDAISRDIVRNPVTIPDQLLYALTTDNIEFLEFCFFIGLSKACKTTTGLSLEVIGDLIGIKDFNSELKKRETERLQREKKRKAIQKTSVIPPLVTKVSTPESLVNTFTVSSFTPAETDTVKITTHGKDITLADITVDQDEVKIKDILEKLPIPEPLVDLFIECQSLSNIDEIDHRVDDPDTLELFIAFKVYIEEKIKSV